MRDFVDVMSIERSSHNDIYICTQMHPLVDVKVSTNHIPFESYFI